MRVGGRDGQTPSTDAHAGAPGPRPMPRPMCRDEATKLNGGETRSGPWRNSPSAKQYAAVPSLHGANIANGHGLPRRLVHRPFPPREPVRGLVKGTMGLGDIDCGRPACRRTSLHHPDARAPGSCPRGTEGPRVQKRKGGGKEGMARAKKGGRRSRGGCAYKKGHLACTAAKLTRPASYPECRHTDRCHNRSLELSSLKSTSSIPYRI